MPVSRILSPRMGDDHLSGARVTERLDATWLVRTGQPYNRAILLRVGFTRARVTARLRELLPHDFTLAWAPGESTRYVSVALSFELPRQDVILHPAL